jgi:hypothetical protein
VLSTQLSRAPLSEVLARRPEFEFVTTWQNQARAAIEGERELALLRRNPLSPEQARAVLKDTADLVRGLVILDRRHDNIPGWWTVPNPTRLLDAAQALSFHKGQPVDHSVDALGWRTPPSCVHGPALPGLAGVLQAQYNVIVDLAKPPSATHLRHILVGQTQLSSHAAKVADATDPDAHRAVRRSREPLAPLGGSLPAGRRRHGCRSPRWKAPNAAQRIRSGTATEPVGESLNRLAALNDRVDAGLCAAIEHGFREKLYFTALTLEHLGPPGRGGVQRPAQSWMPVDAQQPSRLRELVHRRLRPVPPMTLRPQAAVTNGRVAFEQSLNLARGRPAPVR